jgi:type VI secretion system secreted protein Hcp
MTTALLEAFLKLDGIEGESTVRGHEKEMVVLSYEQSIDAAAGVTSGGGSLGKAAFSGVRFRKPVDKASIPLLLACAAGTHIKNARFAFRRTAAAVPIEFYKVSLDDVTVAHMAQRAGTGPQYPLSFDTLAVGAEAAGFLDDVAFSYVRIKWEYAVFDATGAPAGTVKGGWDRKLNKKI